MKRAVEWMGDLGKATDDSTAMAQKAAAFRRVLGADAIEITADCGTFYLCRE